MTVGRGKGGEAKEGPTTELERYYASQFAGETAPIRSELASQIQEALTTGGIGAQIPLAQQSVQNIGQAGAATQKQIKENLAGSGLARSPYGQRILAEAQQSTGLAQSQAMTDIARAFTSLAPSYATGGLASLTPITQAEVGYEGMTTSMANSKRAFNAQVMSSVIQASSSAAGGGMS